MNMQEAGFLDEVFSTYPLNNSQRITEAVTSIGVEQFSYLADKFRTVAVNVLGNVLSMSADQVIQTAMIVDAVTPNDTFLRADSEMPLLEVEQRARMERKNAKKILRGELALRIARRVASEKAGFDPENEASYQKTINNLGFKEMSRFVTVAYEKLAI